MLSTTRATTPNYQRPTNFDIISAMFKFDLIVPIGYACSCSQALRRAGLQLASFPWDWVGVPPPSERCATICGGFKDFMNLEDLEWAGRNDTFGHEEVRNKRNGLIILHDFVSGVPIEDQYPAIAAKYARRIKRLEKCLRAAKRVLLVSIDAPVTPEPISPEDCKKALDIMTSAYPHAEFSILLMNLTEGLSEKNRIDETPIKGVRRVAFDYKSHAPDAPKYGVDIDMLANFLKREYSVRDYRTEEEIAAHNAKKRKKRGAKLCRKMDEIGARNLAQYFLYRIRRVGRKILSLVGPRAFAARASQHRYRRIILLGATPETAFRFHSQWGFAETSLFSGASSGSLDALVSALKHPHAVSEGGFELDEQKHVWRSVDFGLEFRGRLQWKEGATTPSKQQMEEDLADLRVRLEKLAEDLVLQLANGKETLLVYRLAENEGECPELADKLDRLESVLTALGARHWKLLVVCLDSDLSKMPPASSNRIYRGVKAFTPSEHPTWGELGDPVGWNAIFTEFAPAMGNVK